MPLKSPEEAMPWVGLYIGLASLVCTLAMAADVIQGFRERKLWFPCKFFTINATSITLMAIAMKLPVDLSLYSENEVNGVVVSLLFLATMISHSLPSLGHMDDKELLMNVIAMGILLITIIVNVLIGFLFVLEITISMAILSYTLLILPFSVALTVSSSRSILDIQYKELQRLDSDGLEINFSYKELVHHVKKYWMMAETGNPQFVIACSTISCASGLLSFFMALFISSLFLGKFFDLWLSSDDKSDYKWSMSVILHVQSLGVVVGCIAPTFRYLAIFSNFNLSRKWSMNQLNLFRIEEHWTEGLQKWKRSHVGSNIQSRHCRKVIQILKNMIVNFVLVLQIMVLVICKTICLFPLSFLIFLTCCCMCNPLFKRAKKEPRASNSNVRSEMDEYSSYVLQIEEETKLSKRILKNAFNTITKLIHESSEKQPDTLIKLLKKSTGFNGVEVLDNDQVPSLNSEETKNCWSLVVVTLTAIALALPNIGKGCNKELLDSMMEGLELVRHIEESLDANGELAKVRKTARRLWTEVELYSYWLKIDLQKQARKQETSKEILQWLGDEAVKIRIQFKTCKSKAGSLDDTFHNFIAASSMYRISQTILLHCNEQENWPGDEELFEWISSTIADLLCACFTNLPRVIRMKCHHNAIEKREESIHTAAQILGKSKNILKILKVRQLPNMDVDSMAYIDEWHGMLKSQTSNACPSSTIVHSDCSSSDESLNVNIV